MHLWFKYKYAWQHHIQNSALLREVLLTRQSSYNGVKEPVALPLVGISVKKVVIYVSFFPKVENMIHIAKKVLLMLSLATQKLMLK